MKNNIRIRFQDIGYTNDDFKSTLRTIVRGTSDLTDKYPWLGALALAGAGITGAIWYANSENNKEKTEFDKYIAMHKAKLSKWENDEILKTIMLEIIYNVYGGIWELKEIKDNRYKYIPDLARQWLMRIIGIGDVEEGEELDKKEILRHVNELIDDNRKYFHNKLYIALYYLIEDYKMFPNINPKLLPR